MGGLNIKFKNNLLDLIERFKTIHGERYIYIGLFSSKHKNNTMTYICPTHGPIEQSVDVHLRGFGCKYCGHRSKNIGAKNEFSYYKKQFNEIHNNKYSYEKVNLEEYEKKGIRTKIEIVCPLHGSFFQTISNHRLGQGCPKCNNEIKRNTKEAFIEKSKLIHNGIYRYGLVDYKSYNEPVKIICQHHGVFEQTPSSHLSGRGCGKCYNEFRRGMGGKYTLSDFIKKANKVHNNKFDYSKVILPKNMSKDKVIIICPTHGEFAQSPQCHLSGDGCSKCSNKYKKTLKEFLEIAKEHYGDRYDLSKVDYVNNQTPILIKCPIHGWIYIYPRGFLNGNGCSLCTSSKGENRIRGFLDRCKIHYITEYQIPNYSFRYDFFIPGMKLLIEYDGPQHFIPIEHFGGEEQLEKQQIIDMEKNKLAYSLDYMLIRIPYTQYNNIVCLLRDYLSLNFRYKYKNLYFRNQKEFISKISRFRNKSIEQYRLDFYLSEKLSNYE